MMRFRLLAICSAEVKKDLPSPARRNAKLLAAVARLISLWPADTDYRKHS